MLLSLKCLKDVQNVNSYEVDSELNWTEGDSLDIYFQLIDLSLDKSVGLEPPGRRYVPDAGATLSCVLESVDDAKKVTRLATQPFPQDGSIWKMKVLATDKIRGSPQLRITLSEGSRVTRGVAKLAIKIHPQASI